MRVCMRAYMHVRTYVCVCLCVGALSRVVSLHCATIELSPHRLNSAPTMADYAQWPCEHCGGGGATTPVAPPPPPPVLSPGQRQLVE